MALNLTYLLEIVRIKSPGFGGEDRTKVSFEILQLPQVVNRKLQVRLTTRW
jgi:hypothetical protein